ncbi:hypothetical protein BCR44DRAFT_1428746 [Catenaria anguillulae PL171]|uniref:Ankyrin repeat-containing domain protein n=1 Tax=Catenaria anguillulae PL171 TaxID=765915 RepID=A0A1Y2HY58_9FUNG|nr:hypothetical protein BCR44DRAFT_1428746 [Catenaria anguillulae PL171]
MENPTHQAIRTYIMPTPPTLHLDVVGPILCSAIRLTRPRHPHRSHTLVPILNVLSRSCLPAVSETVIMVMPWIDTNFACKAGDLWLLDTLHTRLVREPWYRPLHFNPRSALKAAVDGGHVFVLDWWLANLGEISDAYLVRELFVAGCELGHRKVVEWFIANGNKNKLWNDTGLIYMASRTHDLAILEYLQANGFPLSLEDCPLPDCISAGQADKVNWWIKQAAISKMPKRTARMSLVAAMAKGDRPSLDQMLALKAFRKRFTAELAAFSCATGDLDFIQYCHKRVSGQVDGMCSIVAAYCGHLHVLDWLLSNGCVLQSSGKALDQDHWCYITNRGVESTAIPFYPIRSPTPASVAIIAGRIQVLDWLLSHSFPFNANTEKTPLSLAPAHVLNWMQAKTPDLIDKISMRKSLQGASHTGNIAVLDWWRSHASKERLLAKAKSVCITDAPLKVLEWWEAAGLCMDSELKRRLFRSVSSYSLPSIEVCAWLLRHKDDMFADQQFGHWIRQAFREGNVAYFDWAHANGLVQPMFGTWLLLDYEFFKQDWPTFLWWIENGGPKLKARLQHMPLYFPNVLMMQVIFEYCDGIFELDGDQLSKWQATGVLEWGRKHGFRIHESAAMRLATLKGYLDVLEWWRQHAEQLRPHIPSATSVAKACRGNVQVWTWWVKSGLLDDVESVGDFMAEFGENGDFDADSELGNDSDWDY